MSSIRRAPHNASRPYTQISNQLLQDEGLTYEAAGLLGHVLSRPDDWKIMVTQLQRPGAGRVVVYRILRELMQAGYVTRHVVRGTNGRAKHWEYVVYEDRQGGASAAVADQHDSQLVENRQVEDQPLQTKESTQRKDHALRAAQIDKDEENMTPDTPSKPKAHRSKGSRSKDTSASAPRRPDPVFDAVMGYVFGITEANGSAPRIGMAAAAIRKIKPDATADDVRAFVGWYRGQFQQAAVPRDPAKLSEHFQAWYEHFREGQRRHAQIIETMQQRRDERVIAPLSDEDKQQIRQQLQEVRRKIAAGV